MQTPASGRAKVVLPLLVSAVLCLPLQALAQDKPDSSSTKEAKSQSDKPPSSMKETRLPTKETQAARMRRAKQASIQMPFRSFFRPAKISPKADAVPAAVDKSQSHKQKKPIDLKASLSGDPCERGKELAYRMQYDEAIKYLNKAIEKDPNQAKAYSARAYAYEGLGQHDKAIADCSKAIALDASDPEPYGTRMRAYGASRQMQAGAADEKAVMHLEEMKVAKTTEKYLGDINKSIQRDPQNGVHYIERANAYRGMQQFDKAIDDYTQAIKKDPNSYLAYFNRGQTYMAMKRKDLAERDFALAQQLAASQKAVKKRSI
jgi:tetratricopeptide (TPR) repeat protein